MKKTICIKCFIIFIFTASMCYSQDVTILPIYPVPGLGGPDETYTPGTNVEFSGAGTIDRLATDEIVVNDTLLKLSDDIIYYAKDGSPGSASNFHLGSYVGYLLNSQGKIVSLWKIGGE